MIVMKNKKRVNVKKPVQSAISPASTEAIKEMFKSGLLVAAGSGIAALLNYKVWNGSAWINARTNSSIVRAAVKSLLGVGAALAYAYLVPSMPLIASGIAGYGIFMGGLDLLGATPQLPANTSVSVNVQTGAPASTTPSNSGTPASTPPARVALNPFAFPRR